MPSQFETALRECWRALGAPMVGRTYRFAEYPTRTIKILAYAASPGTVEILENGQTRRYVELAALAQCLSYGVVEEIEQQQPGERPT